MVRLAARLIIEEVLEGEARDALGRAIITPAARCLAPAIAMGIVRVG